jgi:hypothetical protein
MESAIDVSGFRLCSLARAPRNDEPDFSAASNEKNAAAKAGDEKLLWS